MMRGMDMPGSVKPRKGRGAVSNETGRFESEQRVAFDDCWGTPDNEPEFAPGLKRRHGPGERGGVADLRRRRRKPL